ncbi:MAG: hypothetical protein WC797_01155 [Candidatus Paceibacterota bacterium]|jgi:hypothetical protein
MRTVLGTFNRRAIGREDFICIFQIVIVTAVADGACHQNSHDNPEDVEFVSADYHGRLLLRVAFCFADVRGIV